VTPAAQPSRNASRHALPETHWPTESEAQSSLLFSPLTLRCGLKIADRTWVPAMVPWRATEDGFVTSQVLDWYQRFATGRPGVLVVEATGIRDVPSGPLLRIGHDRFLPGLRQLVDTVREASGGQTRLFIQLIDFLSIRRRPDRTRYLLEFLQLTPEHSRRFEEVTNTSAEGTEAERRQALSGLDDDTLRSILNEREFEALQQGARERVTDIHLPHVNELPQTLPGLFSAATLRARDAGFDGVELHYAHAYTMASFLSRKNNRKDGYGGDLQGRIRLPLEVYHDTRRAVGEGFAVGARFLSDEVIEGGSTVEDAAWFATRFAQAGMDFLSLSRGGKFEDARQPAVGKAAYPYTGKSGHACMPTVFGDSPPFGLNLPHASEVRRAVRKAGHDTPIIAAGGISTFELAENALSSGAADLVAAARQSLADPDWFLKIRQGRGHEVQRCLYTNYCEALDQQHRSVTCQLWDRLEGGKRTEDARRRLEAPADGWRAPSR
jgi:dimethylglycine catabolism A